MYSIKDKTFPQVKAFYRIKRTLWQHRKLGRLAFLAGALEHCSKSRLAFKIFLPWQLPAALEIILAAAEYGLSQLLAHGHASLPGCRSLPVPPPLLLWAAAPRPALPLHHAPKPSSPTTQMKRRRYLALELKALESLDSSTTEGKQGSLRVAAIPNQSEIMTKEQGSSSTCWLLKPKSLDHVNWRRSACKGHCVARQRALVDLFGSRLSLTYTPCLPDILGRNAGMSCNIHIDTHIYIYYRSFQLLQVWQPRFLTLSARRPLAFEVL